MAEYWIRRVALIAALVAVSLVADAVAERPPPGRSGLSPPAIFSRKSTSTRVITSGGQSQSAPRSPTCWRHACFELSGGDFRDAKLLVVTDQPAGVSEDEVARVSGIVGQLHTSVPSEQVPYIQHDLYTRYETKPYLYHATVERCRQHSRAALDAEHIAERVS